MSTVRSGAEPAGPPAVGLSGAPGRAWNDLRAGNHRFVAGAPLHPHQDAERRAALADAQAPFAVIFGCSDSRLAAEIIFDQGLGDLFVVRTAGHAIGPEVLGSVEYGVTILGTPLVVVLGHSSCGAVRAAQESVGGNELPAGHLRTVVDAVIPSVHRAAGHQVTDVDGIVDVHVAFTVEKLLAESDVLHAAVARGRCAVVGLSYQLTSGRVRMLVPAPSYPEGGVNA